MTVRRAAQITPRMMRVTFAGPDLTGLAVDQPAASVRLLIPSPGSDELVVPTWNGNEFLLPGDDRPVIRTFTPPLRDGGATELDLWVVLHEGGLVSTWAEGVVPGDQAAASGPGRGYQVDSDAPAFFLAGDETATPAIGQLLEAIPVDTSVDVHIEIAHPDGELPLPHHPGATVSWHLLLAGEPPGATLADAVEAAHLDPSSQVWAAGEAAGMHRIRKFLAAREFPRSQSTVRGYWKQRG